MNALKSIIVLLAMIIIADGMHTDSSAAEEEKACAKYTEQMLQLAKKDGYISIVVDCKTRRVTKKLKRWEVYRD